MKKQIFFLAILCAIPLVQAMDAPEQELPLFKAFQYYNDPNKVKSIIAQALNIDTDIDEAQLIARLKSEVSDSRLLLLSALKRSVSFPGCRELYRQSAALLKPAFKNRRYKVIHNPVLRELIEARDSNGRTILMVLPNTSSCRPGDTRAERVLKLLIAAGADVNARDLNGNTPLMHSCNRMMASDIELVQLLIEAGADINAMNDKEMTALVVAAQFGSYFAIELLLKHGANPDLGPWFVDNNGTSRNFASHTALEAGYEKIADLLNDPARVAEYHQANRN